MIATIGSSSYYTIRTSFQGKWLKSTHALLGCVRTRLDTCRRDSTLQRRADWDSVAAELGTHRTAAEVSAMYGQATDKQEGCPWEMHKDDTKDPPVRCLATIEFR